MTESPMSILAIVGMPGSGKSELAAYLHTRGLPIIRFGGFITSAVESRGLPITPAHEQSVREDLRRQHGMDVCAQLALPVIRARLAEQQPVVIDGLYSLSEYTTLRDAFPSGLLLVAVFTPKTLRYQRLAARRDRPLSSVEAEARDCREIEALEKGGPIALADFTVVNDGTLQQLRARIRGVLPDLWKGERGNTAE